MAKPELRDHRKFLRLRRLLNEPTPHVLGYLECLWNRGYQTGNPVIGDALDVEAAAEYPGEPGKFAKAAADSGLIDLDETTGEYSIHDLFEHAPVYAKKRLARMGNLPEGVTEYAGVKPEKKCRAASKTPKQMPHGIENGGESGKCHADPRTENREPKTETPKPLADEPPVAKKPRKRDPVFDAIADVTGADPSVNGSNIGRIRKLLLDAEPPYTPEEIRLFEDREFLKRELPWLEGRKPTLGEFEKHIGRIRNPSKPNPTDRRTGPPQQFKTKRELDAEFMAKQMADAFPEGRPQ